MEIKTLHRIYDDNGVECKIGDTVLIQTKNMDEVVLATVDKVMTNMATFIVDDRVIGYVPIKVRVSDVISIVRYHPSTS